jgi:hypothetical protein
MKANSTKLIRLALASLMLLIVFSGRSLAQCTGLPCQPLNETFGTPTGACSGQQGAAVAGMVNNCNYPCIGGPAIDDGEYRVSCDGTNFNCGWKGGCSTPIADNTTGSGYFAMINNVADNTEIYHQKVTQLCQGATYNVTFYAANASNYNSSDAELCGYSSENVNLTSYTFAANTAVTAAGAFSSAGATRTLVNTGNIFCTNTTGVVWTAYTQSITITAAEATSGLDLVLISAGGNGAGADFVVDDITITYVSGGPAGFCTTPVTFISFTAEKVSENVILKWSTATEVNNDYFSVEKSMDGIHFEPIGTVKGNGTSNQINYYTFEDYSFNSGTVYYRLKQVDFDNKYEYSKIRAVNVELADPVIITNDPSLSQIFISFFKKGEATFTILDMLGRVVYSGERVSDEPSVTINKSMLSRGFYIVKVQIGSELVSGKIILN